MSNPFKPALLGAVLAALAGGAAAEAPQVETEGGDFARFDATRAGGLAERLVLCDRTRQFISGPTPRDAQYTYVQAETGRFELALPPDFTRASGWYDINVERAYRRYRAAGQVTGEAVRAARDLYRTPSFSRFDRPDVSERRFLRAQSDFCRDLVRSSRRL